MLPKSEPAKALLKPTRTLSSCLAVREKALFCIAKVERDTSVTPKSIEIHWKYGCCQNHELGIVNRTSVFIAEVERHTSVVPKVLN